MSKKLRAVFTSLFALILMLAAFAPLASAIDRPLKGNLEVHKVQFNEAEIPEIEDHDGTVITGLGAPLAGAEFSIYKVAPDAEAVPGDLGTPVGVATTGADGIAAFPNLDQGRYAVVETKAPRGVNYFSPAFLVDVPMTNPAGDGWLDTVHVYAKNQLILATADFTKYFEESDAAEKSATFALYKKTDNDEVLMETASTDANGRVYFSKSGEELGLETGHYIIRETAVSSPYGVSKHAIEFEVTLDDHDSNLNDRIASIHLDEQLKDGFWNYLTPTIDKENKDADGDDYSADYGEPVVWELTARIPQNIADYNYFNMIDTLDNRLDFVEGSLKVTVDGADLPAAAYQATFPATQSGGTLRIDFTPAELAAYAGKDVVATFATKINDTAVMGEEIPNQFTLDFHNGFETSSEKSPTPYTQTGGAKFNKTSNDKGVENLGGAQFWVYKVVNGEKLYLQQGHVWANAAANNNPLVLTSAGNGYFEVKGLAFGTYHLEERVALPGHSLRSDWEFTVNKDSYKVTDPQEVLNNKKVELPSTGGFGTIGFTITGLGLMMGAVKLYRKEREE